MSILRLAVPFALITLSAMPAAAQSTSLDQTAFQWIPSGMGPCMLIAGRGRSEPLVNETSQGVRYTFGADNGRPCPPTYTDVRGPVEIRRIAELRFGPSSLRVRIVSGRWYVLLRDRPNVYQIRAVADPN